MKKVLLAVIIVLMLTNPVLADQIVINGKAYQADTIVQNNSIFVPLRFISENLGANVEWNGHNAVITTLKRPEIIILPLFGEVIPEEETNRITSVISEAMDLLESKDPASYQLLCMNTKSIEFYNNSFKSKSQSDGYFTYATTIIYPPEKGRIVITKEFVNDTEIFKPINMAGTLVHEAVHLANTNIKSVYWDEDLAYLHNIAVLRALEAPQKDIDICEATRKYVLNKLSK